MGAGLSRFGTGMTRWVTRPLLLMGGAAAKLSVDFDTSMKKIEALVGASRKQMAEYRAEIFKLSGSLPLTPKAIADALYFITSSGYEGQAALEALNAVARASAAGLGDLATVADAVTSATNAYGLKALSAGKATDIMLAAVREGKNEPEDLAGSIGRVIPLASEMGVSFDQVAAGLASMSLKGTDAAEGATAMVGVLNSFLDPATQTEDRLRKIGMSADAVRKSLAERGLLPTLVELKDRIGENKEALGDLFPNVRALKGFLALTGSSVKENAAIFKELSTAVGDTDRALEKARKGEGFRFKQAMAELAEAGIEMGDAMMPALLDLADTIKGIAHWFSELPPAMQSSIVKWGALLLVLGPVARLLGSILSTGGKLIGLLPKLAAAVTGSSIAGGVGAGVGGVAATGGAAAATRGVLGSLAVSSVTGAGAGAGGAGAAAAGGVGATAFGIAAPVIAGAWLGKKASDPNDPARVSAAQHAVDDFMGSMRLTEDTILSTSDAMETYLRLQGNSVGLTDRQSQKLRLTIDRFALLGVKLDEHSKQTAENLLKVGDFAGAMGILNRAWGEGIKKLDGGTEALGRFGGSADLQTAKVALLREGINKLPTAKEIRIRANTVAAHAALDAFIARVRNTHLTMNLNLNAGGPMGPGAAPPLPTFKPLDDSLDSGGHFRLPMNAGSYSFPFSKGYGYEDVSFSGLTTGRGRMPSGSRGSGEMFVIKGATLRIVGLDRAVGDFVVERYDESEDTYQRSRSARGR